MPDYLIENKLIFSSEDCTLRSLKIGEGSCTIPRPAGLLLTTLINHSGVLITREELMKQAWEVEGFRNSACNLNTYLSVLRQCLENMGMSKDIITTHPRQGLIMHAAVAPCIAGDDNNGLNNNVSLEAFVPKVIKRIVLLKSFLVILLALSIIALCFKSVITNAMIPVLDISLVSKKEYCNIYSLPSLPDKNSVNLAENFILNEKKIDCKKMHYDIFIINNGQTASFSVCKIIRSNINSCKTFYEEKEYDV